MEYVTKDKEWYLTSMEYTFSAKSSEKFDAHVLGCALGLFSFQHYKTWVRIILVVFSIILSWEEDPKKSQYYAFLDKLTFVVD